MAEQKKAQAEQAQGVLRKELDKAEGKQELNLEALVRILHPQGTEAALSVLKINKMNGLGTRGWVPRYRAHGIRQALLSLSCIQL